MWKQIEFVLITIAIVGLVAAGYCAYRANKNDQKKEKRKAK